MAPRRGTRARPNGPWVNLLGFTAFALAAAALVAAVFLIPAYADLLDARHRRELRAVRNQDVLTQIEADRRVIEAAATDPTFMERLAISQGEFVPVNRFVIHQPRDSSTVRPDVIAVEPTPHPAPPPAWVRQTAQRVTNPRTRRGLLLMAGGLLAVAGLVFTGRFSGGGESRTDPEADA